jgi:hypothetical protein
MLLMISALIRGASFPNSLMVCIAEASVMLS